jgi:hypothetical protein
MKAVIPLTMLNDAGACSDQGDLFKSLYGDSVNVTVARAKKVAHKFNWEFAVRFLDEQGRAEYERIKGAAWAEYQRIEGPALAEYKRIKGAALAEYERIKGAALAEYECIEGPAWAKYKRIQGPAWAEYKRIKGAALAEAYIDACKRQASTGAVS